ncbi:MAG: hypothetical protein OEY37_05475 [Gammaproteobacteria bacterium]|nr:hypothetical protein [Gammaproteobacteria bacterium]
MTKDMNHDDSLVSATYRDLATETAPPELDRKILSMSAGTQRSRYGLARAWIRPVAWAATIGLSLAFVLEMSQLDDVASPPASTEAADVADVPGVRREALTPARQEDREQPPAAMRSDAPTTAQTNAALPATAPDPAAKAEAGMSAETTSVSGDFETADMDMLREAEQQARARSGSEQDTALLDQAAAFDAAMTLEKKTQTEHCSREARLEAVTWIACIQELRDKGLAEAAEQELAQLTARFPDFEEPAQNR